MIPFYTLIMLQLLLLLYVANCDPETLNIDFDIVFISDWSLFSALNALSFLKCLSLYSEYQFLLSSSKSPVSSCRSSQLSVSVCYFATIDCGVFHVFAKRV